MSKKMKFGYMIFTLIVSFWIVRESQASYSEDFENYSIADLTGNNSGTGWSGAWNNFIGCHTAFDVQSGTVQAGTRAVQVISDAGGDRNCGRGLTSFSDEVFQTAYVRTAQTNQLFRFGWYAQGKDYLINVDFRTTGQIAVYDNLTLTDLQAYSANTWYKIDVLPDYDLERFTIEINDVSYGPYNFYAYLIYTYTTIDAMLFQAKDTGTGTFYFDTISSVVADPPASTGYALNLASTSPETNWGEIGQIIWHGLVIFGLVIALIIYII